MRRFAKALLDADMTEEQQPAKLFAYMSLINATEDSEAAIKLLEDAKAFAESKQISTANLLLTEIGLRLRAGDGAGFQAALQAISTRHGNEPEVMAQLQQMLMAYGLIGPDGRPTGAGGPPPAEAASAPADASGGGLWTPDQGSPSGGSGGSGGGKLWTPGMD